MHWYSFLMHCTAYIINYIWHDVCMLKIASQTKLVPTLTRNSWQSYLNNSVSLQKLCNTFTNWLSLCKRKRTVPTDMITNSTTTTSGETTSLQIDPVLSSASQVHQVKVTSSSQSSSSVLKRASQTQRGKFLFNWPIGVIFWISSSFWFAKLSSWDSPFLFYHIELVLVD